MSEGRRDTHEEARKAMQESQRTLLDAVTDIMNLQKKLSGVGYDDWTELLEHIISEVRGECDLLQSTLDADKAGPPTTEKP